MTNGDLQPVKCVRGSEIRSERRPRRASMCPDSVVGRATLPPGLAAEDRSPTEGRENETATHANRAKVRGAEAKLSMISTISTVPPSKNEHETRGSENATLPLAKVAKLAKVLNTGSGLAVLATPYPRK
jgi:hypothetical protein